MDTQNSVFNNSSMSVWSNSDYVHTANSMGTSDLYFSLELSSSTPSIKGYVYFPSRFGGQIALIP